MIYKPKRGFGLFLEMSLLGPLDIAYCEGLPIDPFLGVGLSDCSAMVHIDNTEWSSQLGN